MKVLMFGWEFPPHISGGLGTACEGLTHALAKEHVELIFVVPRLFGKEDQSQFPIISASETPVRVIELQEVEEIIRVAPEPIAMSLLASDRTQVEDLPSEQRTIRQHTIEQRENSVHIIEVESVLLPYSHPSASDKQYTVAQWMEQWHALAVSEQPGQPVDARLTTAAPGDAARTSMPPAEERVVTRYRPVVKQQIYNFSGTYGKDLISETLRYAEVAREIASSQEYDIIHAHDWITYPAGLAAKKASGKKLIVHVHATEIDRAGATPHLVVYAIEKEGMKGADHIVAVSEWTRQIIIRHYDIAPEKISVIHNGVITKPKEKIPLPAKLGTHYVTFLGRITYQKGPLYFVQAAEKVLRQFPDTHFIVAGSGDMLPQMIDLIAKLKLSSHFHFTGFLKGAQIDSIWSATDLYVMPSVSEPFGITPLEASHSGVPVIVSNQSGVAEVMSHSIKVDFWDVDALANAICGVLAYPVLSKSLIANSREELNEISWKKAAEKLKALYDRELNGVQSE